MAGHDLAVTASLGISIYPDDGFDAVPLIKKAETAMRNIKDCGPNGFSSFIEDMNLHTRHRQTLETGLRLALQRQELVLHYQPKLDLTSGTVVGAEALVRWALPAHGLVSPSMFIPVAEDCRLSYLQKFPVDVLKIDQSFVRDLSIDSNDAKLMSSIIDLRKNLNLRIIAEGIESAEQLDFLKRHQCEEGQGFYFSKAVEPEAFAIFLSAPRQLLLSRSLTFAG